MRNRKAAVILVSALLTVALFLSACTSDEGSATPTEDSEGPATSGEKASLQFWTFHTEAEETFFRELVDEYNSIQDDVHIEISFYNQDDYTTKTLPVAFAGESGPDIFMISPGDFMKFANSGIMADLTPYFPEGSLEDFLPSAIEAVTVDDKILALPFEMELLGLYYNEEMLEAANVEVPQTWDELIEAARALNTDETAGIVLPTDTGPYFNFVWYPFLWQQGGDVLNEDYTKSTFDSPEVVQALDLWGTIFQEGLAPSKLQYGPTEIDNLGTGKAAMQVVGTWAIPRIESEFPDVPINVAPIPIPEGGQHATAAGGWKMAVNSASTHVEEAAKFVMWAFGDDPARPLEWSTEVKFAYPARQSVIDAGEHVYTDGLRKVFTEEIYDSAIPEPSFPPEVVDAVGQALHSVMFGGVSGKDAAKEAHQKIVKELE
jgi:multiple sugar transport system substrate-binding protein